MMLDKIIKKLFKIFILCGGIALLLYFTGLGDLFNGEIEKKVEEFKDETKEKIEAKKEEINKIVEEKKDDLQEEVLKAEDKVKSNIKKVEKKVKDLKKLKFKDLID